MRVLLQANFRCALALSARVVLLIASPNPADSESGLAVSVLLTVTISIAVDGVPTMPGGALEA
jgi:hypothetical protein